MNRFLALEKKYQMLATLVILTVVAAIGFFGGEKVAARLGSSSSSSSIAITEEKKQATEVNMVMVNIKGAVKNPGIYEFKEGARINDALQKAVPLENSDLLPLNLAMFLSDEQDIYVPYLDTEGNNEREHDDKLVSINNAKADELMEVPGIGPVMAGNIIDYRKEAGPFKAIEDLLEVTGIGEKTLEKMKPYIKL